MIGESFEIAALSKLTKEEFWTFVYGFGVGLTYFIIVFIQLGRSGWELYIPNNLHAILFLIFYWLLCTLLLYIIYLFIEWLSVNFAKTQLSKPEMGFLKINTELIRFDTIINYDKLNSIYISIIHQLRLIISTCALLVPAIWLYNYLLISKYLSMTICAIVSSCVSIFLITVALIIYFRYLRNHTIDYLKLSYLVNNYKIKITYKDEIYAKNVNKMVDANVEEVKKRLSTSGPSPAL